MSNLPAVKEEFKPVSLDTLSEEKIELLRKYICKNATKAELELVFHYCNTLKLDPFRKHIHFVKYKPNDPPTIIIGIDGFRTIADRTGLHSGTERGALRDKEGKLIGAWAKVYRKDWTQPASVEVELSEYKKGSPIWKTMTSTMIQKCAEVAALRMAFPDHFAGVYSSEELDRNEEDTYSEAKEINTVLAGEGEGEKEETPEEVTILDDPGTYIVMIGKHFGKRLQEIPLDELVEEIKENSDVQAKGPIKEFLFNATAYVESREQK